MKTVDITVLVEDTVYESRLRAEHGLSLHIDSGGYRILFDTGASALFLGNAKKLGVDLNALDALILSHNHYDHTGGLEFLIDLYTGAPPIFGHPKAFEASYARPRNGERKAAGRSIGFPYPLGLAGLEKRGVSVKMNREATEIQENIWLSGEVPRSCGFEETGGSFFMDAGLTQADDLPDDQALIINTEAGLVIITGCCHSGMVNTLKAAQSLFPGVPLYALVGGLHLLHAGARRIRNSVEYLKGLHPALVIAGHCTGFDALCTLRRAFAKRFFPLSVGRRFSLPEP